MENSSVFWNKIAEWLMSLGLPRITEFEAKLIALAAFLVLFIILWLLFRKLRLWYWKTNIQINTLKSIDVRLHNVEEKLSLSSVRIVETAIDGTLQKEDEPLQETMEEKEDPERFGLTAVGKSGRIYTEAELELQIRE